MAIYAYRNTGNTSAYKAIIDAQLASGVTVDDVTTLLPRLLIVNVNASAKSDLDDFLASLGFEYLGLQTATPGSTLHWGSFALADAPGAAEGVSAGDTAYCTDGDLGNECFTVFDGTDWKVVALGSSIATS